MKRVVSFAIVIIGYLILHCSIAAAAGEDIPRPELVKLANEELKRKGLHDEDYFSDKKIMVGEIYPPTRIWKV